MEDRQMNDISSGLTENPRYVWDKKYVRPYESPWSIMRNFTLLNACCGDLGETLSLLGINGIRCRRKPYFKPELMVYLNMTISGEEIIKLTDMLAEKDYFSQFLAVRKVSDKHHSVISTKLKYCPVCMKSGYHSVFHQAAGVCTCFIHKDVRLNTFWNGGYVLGYHEPYKPLSKDERARMTYEAVPLRRKIPDLYSEESFLLPFERNSILIPERPFNERLLSGKTREVFIVEGIADSDIVENPAGMYLIEDEESTLRRRIYSSVYDSKDEATYKKALRTQEFSDTPADKDTIMTSINTHEIDIVSLITQRTVKKLLDGFTMDELKLKEIPLNRHRIFKKPAYVIEKETDGRVNVYVY